MEVLLVHDVPRVGVRGETKRVTEGYARNFLFPRKLAVPVTEGTLSHLKLVQASWDKKAAKEREAFTKLAEKIDGLTIKVTKRAGEKGRLFGSVTGHEISDLIQRQAHVEIEKHHIITDHIKEVGEHEIHVRFSKDAKATLKIVVVPEEVIPGHAHDKAADKAKEE